MDAAPENLVNVINPEGDLVGIPSGQLADALDIGYMQATPEQVAEFSRSQKYGTTGQQAVTALEGAADAATFGVASGVERALGIAKHEDILARREENPFSYGAGQAVGLAGSMLIPGAGEANLAREGAAAVEGAQAAKAAINPLSAQSVLTGAGDRAAEAIGLGAPSGVMSQIGSTATKMAVETALIQSGDEVSRMLLSDPDQTAETAIMNVGLAGVLGGALGAPAGAVKGLWDLKVAPHLGGRLRDVSNEAVAIEQAARAAPVQNQSRMMSRNLIDETEINLPKGKSPGGVGYLSSEEAEMSGYDVAGWYYQTERDIPDVPGPFSTREEAIKALHEIEPPSLSKQEISDYAADIIANKLRAAGLDIIESGSGQSESRYLEVPIPGSEEILKVRISGHELPRHHERPHLELTIGRENINSTATLPEQPSAKQFSKSANEILNQIYEQIERRTPKPFPSEGFAPEVSTLDDQYLQRSMLGQEAGIYKPNADEISGAASRLGIKPTVGTLSDSELVQNIENVLTKRPTIAGQAIAKETKQAFDRLNKAALDSLKGSSAKSEAQLGREIKAGMQETLESELKPIEKRFDNLKQTMKQIGVSEERRFSAIDKIMGQDIVRTIPDSPWAKTAASAAKMIQGLENVDQVKTVRTAINGMLEKAIRAGDSNEISVLKNAKFALNELREIAIDDAAKSTGIGKKPAEKVTQYLIGQLKETDALYRSYKDRLRHVGIEGGLGNVGSARQLLQKFEKMSDEAFARRIFDVNDINQLKFFRENFPKQFEEARRFKLKDIFDKSISHAQGRNGRFEVGSFLRQVREVGPEAKEILFKNHIQKIKDIETIFQAVPGLVNVSGTETANVLGHLFSLKGVADNASDAVKWAVLKGIPHVSNALGENAESKAVGLALAKTLTENKEVNPSAFRSAVRYIDSVIKGENLIRKATGAVFKSGAEVLPAKLIPDQSSREKFDKKLIALEENTDALLGVAGDSGHYLPEHAASVGKSAATAVNYLNSLRPVAHKESPLDMESKVSKAEKAAFERQLDIAQQPLLALQHVKDGTLNTQDLQTIQIVYPALYQKLKGQLADQMIEHISKENAIGYPMRISLSMFMAEPLESSLKPEMIQSLQMSAMSGSAQKPSMMNPKMSALRDAGKSSMTRSQAQEAGQLV